MKSCSVCNIVKDLTKFNNQQKGKFGKRSCCRECQARNKKEYNSKNKEKNKNYSIEYHKKNPKYISEYQKNRRKKDLNFRLIGNLRARLCNIIKNKTKNTLDCLGVDIDKFKQHIQKQFQDGMCWDNYGEWHIDHIIPISHGKNQKEIYKLNYYTNLRPLWKIENLKKSNKLIQQ
jgi:hypothetical protein